MIVREDTYRTYLTDLEAVEAGPDLAQVLWVARLEGLSARSGVANVSSAVLSICDVPNAHVKCARVTFDSSKWTGLPATHKESA
jgi:hypothetical protein